MRFLIDAQLPPGLASWLSGQGHHSTQAFEIGLAGAADAAIWRRAIEFDAVLITNDQDFVVLREHAKSGPSVVWIRLGNATNRILLPWFTQRFISMKLALAAGEAIIEVR